MNGIADEGESNTRIKNLSANLLLPRASVRYTNSSDRHIEEEAVTLLSVLSSHYVSFPFYFSIRWLGKINDE